MPRQLDTYPEGCPWTCTDEMRFNRFCDAECDNIQCSMDAGECQHADLNIQKYSSCGASCPLSYVEDGWCDPECNTTGCLNDGGDCGPRCAPGCDKEWLADGFCDQECDKKVCGYDNGDCYHPPEVLNLVDCSASCSLSWLGDGLCDEECNVPACNNDGGDCSAKTTLCDPACPSSWIGDGSCDRECYLEACSWDGDDCKRFGEKTQQLFSCAPACNQNWLGDGACDTECDTAACEYDLGDCPRPIECSTIGKEGVGKDKPCVFPFKYMGVRFDACTTVDSTTAWCSTQTDPSTLDTKKGQWGNCRRDCDIECLTAGTAGVGPHHKCIFPFWYLGKKYDRCTYTDSDTPWCATQVSANNTMVFTKWGECSHACEQRQIAALAQASVNSRIVLGLIGGLSVIAFGLSAVVCYMRHQLNGYKKLASLGDGIPRAEKADVIGRDDALEA